MKRNLRRNHRNEFSLAHHENREIFLQTSLRNSTSLSIINLRDKGEAYFLGTCSSPSLGAGHTTPFSLRSLSACLPWRTLTWFFPLSVPVCWKQIACFSPCKRIREKDGGKGDKKRKKKSWEGGKLKINERKTKEDKKREGGRPLVSQEYNVLLSLDIASIETTPTTENWRGHIKYFREKNQEFVRLMLGHNSGCKVRRQRTGHFCLLVFYPKKRKDNCD